MDRTKADNLKKKKIVLILSTVASLFGLYLINSGKTFLKTTAEVAGREEVKNYTLPPAFSFSIWGVIYLGFILFALFGLSKNTSKENYWNATANFVSVSIFFNLIWTVLVGLDLWPIAFFLQILMLVVSIKLLLSGKPFQQHTAAAKLFSSAFALYAGWLTVAMVPFVASLLNNSGWNFAPFSQEAWGMIMYVIACLIVWLAYRKLMQPFFLLPVAWALYGYTVRFGGRLETTAYVLAFVMLLLFSWAAVRYFRSAA